MIVYVNNETRSVYSNLMEAKRSVVEVLQECCGDDPDFYELVENVEFWPGHETLAINIPGREEPVLCYPAEITG